MNYKETERQKAIDLRDKIFRDPGGGVFQKKEREFVLNDPPLNIWAGVREDAIEYFEKHKISFWNTTEEPTGHLLSSQIACLNHLYFVRQREDIATAILQGVDANVRAALRFDNGGPDNGYVDFEVIGEKNYLRENHHTRGANATSVDAVMLAEMVNGQRKLFFIEWKYTEHYKGQPSRANGSSGKTRIDIYKPFFEQPDCPIKKADWDGLLTEPYYQLMRQTLLANEMIKAREFGATEYQHLHIIPSANKGLREVNTADGKLAGTSLHEAWTNLLKSPEKYKMIDPKDFIEPANDCTDTRSWTTYLDQRYWS